MSAAIGDRLDDGYAVVEILGNIQAEVSRTEQRLRLVRVGPHGGRYVFVDADEEQARDVSYLLDIARRALLR